MGEEEAMRAWVYIPTGKPASNPKITPSQRTEVDVETLDPLLEKLANEAPYGTRVVVFTNTGTVHFTLSHEGWRRRLTVVA